MGYRRIKIDGEMVEVFAAGPSGKHSQFRCAMKQRDCLILHDLIFMHLSRVVHSRCHGNLVYRDAHRPHCRCWNCFTWHTLQRCIMNTNLAQTLAKFASVRAMRWHAISIRMSLSQVCVSFANTSLYLSFFFLAHVRFRSSKKVKLKACFSLPLEFARISLVANPSGYLRCASVSQCCVLPDCVWLNTSALAFDSPVLYLWRRFNSFGAQSGQRGSRQQNVFNDQLSYPHRVWKASLTFLLLV